VCDDCRIQRLAARYRDLYRARAAALDRGEVRRAALFDVALNRLLRLRLLCGCGGRHLWLSWASQVKHEEEVNP
jgi:hypothetical protein